MSDQKNFHCLQQTTRITIKTCKMTIQVINAQTMESKLHMDQFHNLMNKLMTNQIINKDAFQWIKLLLLNQSFSNLLNLVLFLM